MTSIVLCLYPRTNVLYVLLVYMNRVTSSILLHALGDTIGFYNGQFEFNFFRKKATTSFAIELLYKFIDLGGINHIDLSGWRVSDDTLMHMATIRAITGNGELGDNLKREYLAIYDILNDPDVRRHPGRTTMRSLIDLKKIKWDEQEYKTTSGGSGASMRTSCIGLLFHGDSKRMDLIRHAIESSRITHNHATGILGGVTSALFAALAMENKDVKEWPHYLLKLLRSGIIDKYMADTRDHDRYKNDKHNFISQWERYVETKFDTDGNVIKRKSSSNLVFRCDYYLSNYGIAKNSSGITISNHMMGSGGDDSVIIAYDCLLDAGDNWEKLVIYSMLHVGDTDTTGAIAASWYGIVYGTKNIPEHLFDHIEFKDELIELSKRISSRIS